MSGWDTPKTLYTAMICSIGYVMIGLSTASAGDQAASPAPTEAMARTSSTLAAAPIPGAAPRLMGEVKIVWTEGVKVTATGPAGHAETIDLPASRQYTFGDATHPLKPGTWSIRVTDTVSGLTATKSAQLSTVPVHLGTIILYDEYTKTSPGAQMQHNNWPSTTITLSDFSDQVPTSIPNTYKGFDWRHLMMVEAPPVLQKDNREATKTVITNRPEDKTADSNSKNNTNPLGSLSREQGFNFVSAKFAALKTLPKGERLKVITWRGNKMLSEDSLILSKQQPLELQANYQDITRIEFKPTGDWHYIIYDITVGSPEEKIAASEP